eukprot:GGOE01002456.1.p3 GENE.GGOE01002456.1~~GGOE01002456.1.p3  ORF type:complete len:145 (-),score=56.06 GGOE01002456.1:475-909(-)
MRRALPLLRAKKTIDRWVFPRFQPYTEDDRQWWKLHVAEYNRRTPNLSPSSPLYRMLYMQREVVQLLKEENITQIQQLALLPDEVVENFKQAELEMAYEKVFSAREQAKVWMEYYDDRAKQFVQQRTKALPPPKKAARTRQAVS